MFNVTNVQEIMTDSSVRPIVKEVGPYVYKQRRVKENITYDEDEDFLEYLQYSYFTFDADESYPLTEDDEITIVNILLNSYFNMGSSILPEELHYILDDYWRYLFSDEDTLFHTVRVGDVLFDGYKFCEPDRVAENTIAETICSLIKLVDLSVLKVDDDGSILFSLFSYKNGQHDGLYTISAGIKDVNEVGQIQLWNGARYLDTWNDGNSVCNRVSGSDGTIYPPFRKEGEKMAIFATELCRTASIYHVGDDEVEGIKGHRKILNEDTFALSNPENSCFCMESARDLYGQQKCLPDGFFDLQPCLGAPLVASFPHFLFGDEEYSKTVDGLSPNSSIHGTHIVIEPNIGLPLSGFRRVQFNAIMRPLQGVEVTQVKNAIIPILWVEEGVAITEEYADMYRTQFANIMNLVEILKWIIIALGIVMFVGFGSFYIYKLCFTIS